MPRRSVIAAALATLTFVGCVALVVRSHAVGDEFRRDQRDQTFAIEVSLTAGRVFVWTSSRERLRPGEIEKLNKWWETHAFEPFHYHSGVKGGPFRPDGPRDELVSFLLAGFEYYRWRDSPPPYGSYRRIVALPLWLPLLLSGAAAGWLDYRLLRRVRRRGRGLCPRCGYDLRGSKDSGRCPECGTAAALPATTRAGELGAQAARPREITP